MYVRKKCKRYVGFIISFKSAKEILNIIGSILKKDCNIQALYNKLAQKNIQFTGIYRC